MSVGSEDSFGTGVSSSTDASRVLRRVFLTLFLRGRSARSLHRVRAPKSIRGKLATSLFFYGLIGFFAVVFLNQSLFSLSVYLHAMTFVFVGMFVASSAGDVLFNREEADILLHRPVQPRALLWAKIVVLLQVSLWLATAFNITGLAVGMWVADGSWLYPLVHTFSTGWLALFCVSIVVLAYQLCLRWLGRDRLDNVMTMVQVLFTLTIILGSQAVPYVIGRFGQFIAPGSDHHAWWVYGLPPAWFAGLDDALAGRGPWQAWMLGGVGMAVTSLMAFLAFGKLARGYVTGLQSLHETGSVTKRQPRRRQMIRGLAAGAWMRRLLPDSASRGTFLLTLAYLARDRGVKLRVFPGLAPLIILPLIFLIRDISQEGAGGTAGFGVAFAGGYLGVIPMVGLNLMQYTQQWEAAGLFRVAPIPGPASLSRGARWAVLFFLAVPLIFLLVVMALLVTNLSSYSPLLIPGLIAMPIYAIIPCLRGGGVPLSRPIEEANAAKQGLTMIAGMILSMVLSGLSLAAWKMGWFGWLLGGELVVVILVFALLRHSVERAPWQVWTD